MERILNKIQKKIDQIEKLHDKESLLCEEVKDLIEEFREDNVEESIEADDLDDEEFEEDIDEDEENKEKYLVWLKILKYITVSQK